MQWPWLSSSGQRMNGVGNAAEYCRGAPLSFWEVACQVDGTCVGAMGYRECF